MGSRKDVLLKGLGDRDEYLRLVSAEAMERLELRARLHVFKELIETGDKLEKLKAIYAIGNLRGKDVEQILLLGIKDGVEDVRAASIRTLSSFADSRILTGLVEALNDESSVVERVAVEAVGNYREPQLISALMQKLKSKDLGVIERAIDIISRLGDKRTEEAMVYYAIKGNTNVRALAIKALGMMEV